jgi:cadmium resistance protein CadD (predicted permease)
MQMVAPCTEAINDAEYDACTCQDISHAAMCCTEDIQQFVHFFFWRKNTVTAKHQIWEGTLLGSMPTLTVALLTFSRVIRSMWITHFFL